MIEPKKVTASIYCKMGCENYPIFEEENTTGDKIVEHLLSDCGYAWINDESNKEGGYSIPGDLCIWYLGSNEKFGGIYLKIDDLEWEWEWGFGESNFGYITEFVDVLKEYQIITSEQYSKLENAIKIGKTINDMYLIPEYLQTIKEEKKWIPRITTMKQDMKKFLKTVRKGFEEKGEVYFAIEGKRKRSTLDEIDNQEI